MMGRKICRAAVQWNLKLLSGLTSSSAVDYDHGFQKPTGLWPSFFNVAMRATISVNATCGQHGKEEYCRLQDPHRSRSSQCGICDGNNPDLEKRHPITNIVDGTNSWWQSPTMHKSSKNDRVTISLDLGQGEKFDEKIDAMVVFVRDH
ncbi:AAEL001493-PA [Aedes aegypti]|uniref:AAEL001493-PA n=1 Tax=Aedes aegypti TaxID=7159 RepID=Q17L46_AEDAE|nr:AAEL001493-PA [Aedes aegypti]